MQPKFLYSFLFLIIVVSSCNRSDISENKNVDHKVLRNTGLKYSKRFAVYNQDNYIVVSLFGNRNNYDTTETYILSKDTIGLKQRFTDKKIIKIPCKKIAALSSIYAAMLEELGELDNIYAIDNIDYINSKKLVERYKSGKIKELAKTPDLDIEQTILLSPDIVFTYGMGYDTGEDQKKLSKLNIPIAISVDHLEESPLARAEWIKFFGTFVDKRDAADSIFSLVEKNYLELSETAKNSAKKPTVFSETKYGDVWYMPGGKSYISKLLNDAGAEYLWKDNGDVGSLPLSFEQVYSKAREGDYWINLPMVKSRNELTALESRYSEFKAFKNDNVYNNDKFINAKGYSIYWESGMMYPDRILSDLVQIFHPELKGKIGKDFYYYQKLK